MAEKLNIKTGDLQDRIYLASTLDEVGVEPEAFKTVFETFCHSKSISEDKKLEMFQAVVVRKRGKSGGKPGQSILCKRKEFVRQVMVRHHACHKYMTVIHLHVCTCAALHHD